PGSTRGRAGGGAFHRGPVRTAPPAPPPPPPGRRRPDPSVKRRPGARRGAGGAPRGPPPVPRADRAGRAPARGRTRRERPALLTVHCSRGGGPARNRTSRTRNLDRVPGGAFRPLCVGEAHPGTSTIP